MKLYLVIFLYLTSLQSFASQNFLKCLGQEEKIYHKNKKAGALLRINQDLISEMVQLSETLDLKEGFKTEICLAENYPSSIELLRLMLKEQKNLFEIKTASGDVVQRSQDLSAIQELLTKSAYLFIKLINHVQSGFSKANCVIESIPEVAFFYRNARYILEDKGIEELLPKKDKIDIIFKKLFSKELSQKCKS